MNEPINNQLPQLGHKQLPSKRLKQLTTLLKQNRVVQNSLKRSRGIIAQRMDAISQYISTYRLKEEHPPPSAMISLLRYERNPSPTYLELEKLNEKDTHRYVEEPDSELKTAEKGKKKRKNKNMEFDVAQLPKNPRQINFVELAKTAGFSLPIDLYKEWWDKNRVKDQKIPFSQDEEKQLIKLCQKYPNCWQKICQIMDWRPFQELYYQYNNKVNPKILTGRWTIKHSLMLVILLEHFGPKKWSSIAQKIVVKSQLQVRERYCNVLDPDLGKDSYWTEEMERTLFRIAGQYEYCWNNIAKIPIFRNKSDNCIWRKFRSLCVKMTVEQIEDFVPKKELAKKIIKYKECYDSRSRRYPETKTTVVFDPNSRARLLKQNLVLKGNFTSAQMPQVQSKTEEKMEEQIKGQIFSDSDNFL